MRTRESAWWLEIFSYAPLALERASAALADSRGQTQKLPSISLHGSSPDPSAERRKEERKFLVCVATRKLHKGQLTKPFAPYPCGDPRRNTMRSALRRRQICLCLPRPPSARTTSPAVLKKNYKTAGPAPLSENLLFRTSLSFVSIPQLSKNEQSRFFRRFAPYQSYLECQHFHLLEKR